MNTAELKKLAEAVSGWKLDEFRQSEDDKEAGVALVGGKYEDGEFAEVMTIDTGYYYQDDKAIKLARFYAAANPAAILKLLAINAELVEALNDAATSLETINRLAGKASYGVDEDGPIPTYMGHHDDVRAYAGSRAGCARAALAKAEGGEL